MTVPSIYGSPTTGSGSSTVSTDTFSVTVPSGRTDPCLLVWLTFIDNQDSNSYTDDTQTVKWGGSGGTALTKIAGSEAERQSNTRTIWGAWYYLLDPTPQTSTIYWDTTGSAVVAWAAEAILLEHVPDSGTVLQAAGANFASGDSAEASLTASSGDSLLLYSWTVRGGDQTISVSGATELTEIVSGADATIDLTTTCAYETGASGTQTATGSWSSEIGIWSAIQIAGAASGPTYTLTASTGSFTLTGVAATPKAGRKLTASAGAFTLTGNAASIALGFLGQVGASNHDATQYGSTVLIGQSSLPVTGNLVGFYFTGTGLPPQGADITSAVIEVEVIDTSVDDIDAVIYAYDADTGTVFSETDDFISDLTPTTASVSWVQSSAGAGWQTSPDISTVIQELVDRAGWDASSFNIIFDGGTGAMQIRSYDAVPNTLGAKIRITYTPTAGPDYTLTAGTGSFTLTGQAATPKAGRKISAAVGTFTLTGQAATPKAGRKLTASVGTFTLTGIAATPKVGRKLSAAVGTFTLTGNAATLKIGRTIAGSVGAFTLTGNAAGLNRGYPLTAEAGTFTLTGNAAGLTAARLLSATAGSFTLTGNDVAFTTDLTLTAEAGAFTLTGNAAGLVASRVLTAAAGTFTLTGNDAAFSSDLTLTAEAGAFTLTGNDAGLTVGRVISGAVGAFTLTGNAAGMTRGRVIVTETGAFTLTGYDVTFASDLTLTAEAGAFTFTGNDAGLIVSRLLSPAVGAFTLTGNAAGLNRGYSLAAAAGSYALTGQAATMTAARLLQATVVTYALIGFATGFATGTVAQPNAERTFTVPFDRRWFVVVDDRRGFVVAAEPRTFEVMQ